MRKTATTIRAQIAKHEVIRLAKEEKLQMMEALLEMHKQQPHPDYSYLKRLRYRIQSVKAQIKVMAKNDI